MFQTEGAAQAKVLREEAAWCLQLAWRKGAEPVSLAAVVLGRGVLVRVWLWGWETV